MAKEIDVRRLCPASQEAIWRLLGDSTTWPSWTAIDSCTIERPAGPAQTEIRRFVNGRVTVREEVVVRRECEQLSYELLDGLAVRDYRADIRLSRADGGTEIHWHTVFEPKTTGTGWVYRLALGKATEQFVDGLVAACGARDH